MDITTEQLFDHARTHNGFSAEPVPEATLRQLWALLARPARNDLGCKPLREDLHLLGQRHIQHRALAVQQLIYAPRQRRPMRLGQIEVAAQVEQGGLLDGAANALTVHQAVGDIGLARDAIAGLGAANEHARDVARKASPRRACYKLLWHYISSPTPNASADKDLRVPND